MEKKRILVADDEKCVRGLLVDVLKTQDCHIDLATNGYEAIRLMEKRSYDLIITDYMMPKMNGLELTRRVRSRYPFVPILVVTGEGPVQDLLRSGATACILKPFRVIELQTMVKSLLIENIKK